MHLTTQNHARTINPTNSQKSQSSIRYSTTQNIPTKTQEKRPKYQHSQEPNQDQTNQ
jgi:hypothetical protein